MSNHKFLFLKFKFFLILILNVMPKIILKYINKFFDSIKQNKENNIRLD